MFNVEMRKLSQDEENEVVMGDPASRIDGLKPLIQPDRLLAFQLTVRDVVVPVGVQKYIVNLTSASRPGNGDAIESVNKYVAWGAGVRATQYLALGAKARAAMAGRGEATVEDVKAVALPVMRHRIGVNFRAENDGVAQATIVGRLVESVKA